MYVPRCPRFCSSTFYIGLMHTNTARSMGVSFRNELESCSQRTPMTSVVVRKLVFCLWSASSSIQRTPYPPAFSQQILEIWRTVSHRFRPKTIGETGYTGPCNDSVTTTVKGAGQMEFTGTRSQRSVISEVTDVPYIRCHSLNECPDARFTSSRLSRGH